MAQLTTTTHALSGAAAILFASGIASSGAYAADGAQRAPAFDSAFWKQWGDGQAELDGYTLARDRYGEKRRGTVVAIFVTEPWSVSDHVKADDGKHEKSDVIQAIKLNLVEDFQTGIYDYNLMTSSWVALTAAPHAAPIGATPKVAFSAQEWCGTTYNDLVFDEHGSAAEIVRSYFDGETGMHTLAPPATSSASGALVEDALLLWARGLASPVVKAGESADVAFLPALARARLLHKPLAWTTAKLSREATSITVDVPAGTIACTRAHVVVADGGVGGGKGRNIDLCIENAAPHRVVTLSSSDGYALALTGTVRTPYWQKNHEGDEKMLEQLGLQKR